MTTFRKTAPNKRKYVQPQIYCVKLDKEISLVMQSYAPDDPPDGSLQPEHFSFNPFKLIKL